MRSRTHSLRTTSRSRRTRRFSSALEGARLRFTIASPRASSCISSALGILGDAKLFQEVWALTA